MYLYRSDVEQYITSNTTSTDTTIPFNDRLSSSYRGGFRVKLYLSQVYMYVSIILVAKNSLE